MLIEYDGSSFHGWQIQPDLPTVQKTIEIALATALRFKPNLVGSGRTDAGVHARGQIAHFDTKEALDPFRLKASLNGLLPDTIGILALEATRDDFHARYDAVKRTYHYYISTEKHPLALHYRALIRPAPDVALMDRAAQSLLGRHNFSAFCRVKSETQNRVCNVQTAIWTKETYEGDWCFKIEADRFLHGMVRAITGTLLEVGHGKRPPESIRKVLASEDRTEAGPAAPAHGLVLEQVTYAQ